MSEAVAFVGLGRMGLPMALQLARAGYDVRGADTSPDAREALAAAGGRSFDDAAEAARGCGWLVTMLPTGDIVRGVLLAGEGPATTLRPGAVVIEMSSSEPRGTVALGAELSARGLRLIDAPVSGGVRRAVDGSLAIMVGGRAEDISAARPLLEAMGGTIMPTGPLGSGHAMKALNNYVSAAGLAAAAEAVIVGERFGITPETVVDVLNASTGRNNSTELKMKQQVISGAFASGFSMALMAKDLNIAAELARETGGGRLIGETAALWSEASRALGLGADHTEIARFLGAPAPEAVKP